MKNIFLTATLLLSVLIARAQVRSATLSAGGLTCSMCSKAVYKALSKVDFVASVESDIEHSMYALKFKPGKDVLPQKLRQAVENAGFSVIGLVLEADILPEHLADDKLNISGAQYGGASFFAGKTRFQIIEAGYLSEEEAKDEHAPSGNVAVHRVRRLMP